MYRSHTPGPDGRPSRRRWRRRPIAIAISASLLGATALTTSASAANDGSAATSASSQAAERPTSGGLVRAVPATVTGTTADGTPFNGTFTLERFKQQHGTLHAVGQLQGTVRGKPVSKRVSLPVQGGSNEAPAQGLARPHGLTAPAQATPGACSILALDLAPIDLNLLGLRVFLDEVHLLIEAIPGAGALLGNLLCAVVGLLDGGLLGGALGNLLSAITDLLNALLGAV